MVYLHWKTPRQKLKSVIMACIESCGGAHTIQIETEMQHIIGICIVSVGSVNEPLSSK